MKVSQKDHDEMIEARALKSEATPKSQRHEHYEDKSEATMRS
jgi:hypothetical protein